VPFRPFSALSGRRWWRAWLVLAVIVFALALAVQALGPLRTAGLSTGQAQWIWKAIDRKDHDPTAFYAIRDFDLESPPGKARLLITADEEYVATLNGKRIAAGTFAGGSGTQLDAYEVGPLLLPGGNRLIVELRSGRGAGGLLASLEDEATGRPIVVSDESWRIFPRHELGLVRGWLPIDRGDGEGEPAFCWGYPPIGRWGRPRVGPPEPLLPSAPLVPTASARPLSGSILLYDWGREVEGYLTLDLLVTDKPGVGLLYTGDEPPNPRRAPLTAPVLILPGRHDWMDARPRRFRYAVIVGLARPAAAAVLPAPARPALPRDPDEMRVFGVEGPPLRTPVEDEVWSKLQSLAGIARRKDL
jgi:hypothetical protein